MTYIIVTIVPDNLSFEAYPYKLMTELALRNINFFRQLDEKIVVVSNRVFDIDGVEFDLKLIEDDMPPTFDKECLPFYEKTRLVKYIPPACQDVFYIDIDAFLFQSPTPFSTDLFMPGFSPTDCDIYDTYYLTHTPDKRQNQKIKKHYGLKETDRFRTVGSNFIGFKNNDNVRRFFYLTNELYRERSLFLEQDDFYSESIGRCPDEPYFTIALTKMLSENPPGITLGHFHTHADISFNDRYPYPTTAFHYSGRHWKKKLTRDHVDYFRNLFDRNGTTRFDLIDAFIHLFPESERVITR